MDTILSQGNFNAGSMEGATFGEYKTSSNVEGVQSSFTSSVTGVQSSTESLGGLQNLGNFQSTNSNSETLPTISPVTETTDYQGTNENGGFSLGQVQTSSTSTQNITQTLPTKFLPLITHNTTTGQVDYQSTNATTSSTTVDINALQTSSSFDASATNFDINSFQNTQSNVDGGVSLDNFQTTNTTETTISAGLDTQVNTASVNANDFQTDFNTASTSLELKTVPTTTNLDAGAFQTSAPIESGSSLDLNNLQATTSVDISSNTQAFDVNALQTATPNLETSSTLQTGTLDLTNLGNRQVQTFDASTSQIEQSNITPTFDINAFQTTSTTNVETTTQNVDFGTTENVTSTPSFDLNALGTTSTTETQNFDINAFQTTSTTNVETTTQNVDFGTTENVTNTPSFDVNALATTSTTETQNFDINALQTTSTTNVDTTTQNIDFGTTENVTTTPSFDLNALGSSSTTETQNFDINAFQTSTTNVDNQNFATTPSFDLSAVNTSSTLDTAHNLDVNAFQTSAATTNVDTTVQNVTTTTTTETQNFDVNAFQSSAPSFDLNAFQTASTTNANDLGTGAFSLNQASDSSNIVSQATQGVPSESATFGEYQTTTTINGVQSKYMPQVDASLNAFQVSNSVNLPASSSPIAFPEKTVTSQVSNVNTFVSSQLAPIPEVPSSAAVGVVTPIQTDYVSQVPSVATVTPLKGSLAVGGKIIAHVTPMSHGGNFYTSSTYKPNLRNVNIGSRGHTGQRFGGFSFGKKGSFYRPKDFNSNTYNPKTNKF